MNLRTGGLLCLRNTSYTFADLALSHRYGRIRTDLVFENGFVPQLRPDGAPACRVVPRQFTNLLQRGVLDGLEDWDLIDTVFRKMPAPALAPEVTFHSMVPSLPDPGEPLASWSYSTLDGWDGPPEEVLEIQRHYRLQRDPKNPDQSEVVGTLRRQSFRGQGWLTFMLEPRSIPA
ncbi:hypothetical protein [Falsiroseomonas selenitidurans]|uniref:Uncharacterized protein n=1 Tax=Falsiroseomonas selenitidurans TaxID=2716335 RepID=A0ABX1DZQ9_9PROT|nr:hypothetical protein [Falsiroseomonas selenitidurans]NKC30392.1 hypothetical protein [Falsiroseomonas selenitidurans]